MKDIFEAPDDSLSFHSSQDSHFNRIVLFLKKPNGQLFSFYILSD